MNFLIIGTISWLSGSGLFDYTRFSWGLHFSGAHDYPSLSHPIYHVVLLDLALKEQFHFFYLHGKEVRHHYIYTTVYIYIYIYTLGLYRSARQAGNTIYYQIIHTYIPQHLGELPFPSTPITKTRTPTHDI